MNFKLKKGKYFISDPCYLYDDDKWNDFCDRLWALQDENGRGGVEMEDFNGKKFWVIPTKYGDGSFFLRQNTNIIGELGVDSGLLSVVPLKVAKSWSDYGKIKDAGVIVELDNNSELESNNGNFRFGPFEVITDGSNIESEVYE